MVDVFISYSRSNRDRVRVLADAVKALGYIVWWDDELPPHKSYGDVITEKIATARAAIVCWSGDAAQSEWVRAEADLARNQKKLIQTSYDDVMPPMPFNQIQFASLSDWQGQADHTGWRKVQASLTDLCGPPGATAPVTAARVTPPPVHAPPPPPSPPAPEPAHRSAMSPALLGGIVVVLLIGLAAGGWLALGGDDEAQIDTELARGDAADEAPVAVADDSGQYRLGAVIDDSDGYTNMRAQPSSDAEIVSRVRTGEAFTTFEQSGPWWKVRSADGLTGYMARSRIRLLRDGMPVPATPAGNATPVAVAGGDTPVASPVPVPVPVPGPASADRDGQIIPDSDTRRLTGADVATLGLAQLRLARNEIYARKGRRFQNAELRTHFSRFGWYRPVADEVTLNSTEQANVALLSSAERGR